MDIKSAQEIIKQLEQELNTYKSEVFHLKALIEEIPGNIYWKNKDGTYLDINNSTIKALNNYGFPYSKKDIIGKTDFDLFPEELAKQFREHDLQVLEKGLTLSYEESIKIKDKTFIQFSTKAPLLDTNNNIKGIIGNSVDITHLKEIEADLKQDKENAELANQIKTAFICDVEKDINKLTLSGLSNFLSHLNENDPSSDKKAFILDIINAMKGVFEINNSAKDKEIYRLRNVIENLPGSIYWKDQNGVYLGINHYSLEKMRSVNLDWKDIAGKTDYDLFSKEIADAYRQNDLEVMATGVESSKEEIVTLPNGEILIQLSSKRPLRDEHGTVVGIIGNTVDITYLKKIEAELKEAKEKAEAANKLKSAFIMDMEHDIRTPFSGIYSITTYLYEKESDNNKKEILGQIANSAKELLDYCNTILDFSRIESGSLPLIEKKFELEKLLDSVISIEKPAARFKNLDLVLDKSIDLPLIVVGDEYRLQRILINLLSNSIKFTKTGYIKLSTKLQNVDDKKAIISFIVEDTGIGIPKNQQEMIFEKFTRVVPANKNLYKGSGLGLKAVKQFINEMEGEIEIISEADKGTIFICTLPFKLPLVNEIADFETIYLNDGIS